MWRTIALDPSARAHTTGARGEVGLLGDAFDHLVGDTLTLASAEAVQLTEPKTIDLQDFFQDLRRDLPLFGDRDFRLHADDGTLRADPSRLTQVLYNLVRNAVAHTEAGDRVTVLARGHDGRLEISVSDTGPGIPPDQLDRIFERFHRVDGSPSRDDGGAGLGLAIARAIVDARGGRISAASAPGHGATLRIELPDYQPARQDGDSAGGRAAAAEERSRPPPGLGALLRPNETLLSPGLLSDGETRT
jgi:signal transduction histidine kinase